MNSFDVLSKTTSLSHRLFLQASAGTGKTFVIEHLFVRLLIEKGLNIEDIVVLTFTRAATRELRSRIRENLEGILRDSSRFEYAQNLDYSQKEKLQSAVLGFEKSHIYTIHGFCYRLLQEFAFEAKVGVNLKEWSLDEMRTAVLDFLRDHCPLSRFQLQKLLNVYQQDIEKLSFKLCSSGDKSDFSHIDDLIAHFNSELGFLPSYSFSCIFKELQQHYKGIQSSHFEKQAELLDHCLQKKSMSKEELDVLLEEEFLLEKLNPSYLKVRSQNYLLPQEIKDIKKCILPFIQKARNPKFIFSMLSEAWNRHRKLLSIQQEKIVADDLLYIIQDSLRRHENFSKQIQKKYQALIVDEFQDTDPIQWEIFEKLFFKQENKYVYLVGDPKQAIYAFRHADIYTFLNVSKKFLEEEKAFLVTNYRSNGGLVETLNRLFCQHPWMDLPRLKQNLLVPLSKSENQKTGDLYFIVAEEELGLGKRWPNMRLEQKYLFPFIIHEIQRLKLNPDSCAVLVKDRYQALRLKQYLDLWKIPCIVYRSPYLGKSIIIDLLEEVIQTYDKQASKIRKFLLGCFVRTPLDQLSDELIAMCRQKLSRLMIIWEKEGFFSFIGNFLKTRFWDNRTALQQLLIEADEDLYEDLIELLPRFDNLQTPLQVLKELDNLKHKEGEDRLSKREHGLRILTIYGSKGLEFDTVFALGVSCRSIRTENSLEDVEIEEINAEKMRQLYVALTRAKTRVYVPILRDNSHQEVSLTEESPIELFLKKIPLLLESFPIIHLNQLQFQIGIYSEKNSVQLKPPIEQFIHCKPFYSHSYSSLKSEQAYIIDGSSTVVIDSQFPSGLVTGQLLHKILERYFNENISLEDSTNQTIHGTFLEEYREIILDRLGKVLELNLDGFSLKQVSCVFAEMEFVVSMDTFYLKGSIDLCVEYNKRYYIIDWKTNILNDYNPKTLYLAMKNHNYFLQGDIYGYALKQHFLQNKELEFGGVYFIFIRGPSFYHYFPKEDLCLKN